MNFRFLRHNARLPQRTTGMYNACIQTATFHCSNQRSRSSGRTTQIHTPAAFLHAATVADRPDAGCCSTGPNLSYHARQSTMTAQCSPPCIHLPTSRQRIRRSLMALLIGAAVLSCFDPSMAGAAETEIPATATQAVPSPESTPQPNPAAQPDTIEDGPCLKHRYPQDPTGTRARLGMCRRGEQGRGGRHHRPPGGPWWNQP